MLPNDLGFLTDLLYNQTGIKLSEDKLYLVENRLGNVARTFGYESHTEVLTNLRKMDPFLVDAVIDAMTTNETFFFRDKKIFDGFRDVVLPNVLSRRANKKTLRIWSAASSTGQEAYSIAMILNDFKLKLRHWRTEVVGTDISSDSIQRARTGCYSKFEVQRGLPVEYLTQHFSKSGKDWTLAPEIRAMVRYKKFNLLDKFSQLGRFDIIFCRNVLIYFDKETKKQILDRMAALLPPDGILYLGGAETVVGVSDSFAPVPGQRGVFAHSSSIVENFPCLAAVA